MRRPRTGIQDVPAASKSALRAQARSSPFPGAIAHHVLRPVEALVDSDVHRTHVGQALETSRSLGHEVVDHKTAWGGNPKLDGDVPVCIHVGPCDKPHLVEPHGNTMRDAAGGQDRVQPTTNLSIQRLLARWDGMLSVRHACRSRVAHDGRRRTLDASQANHGPRERRDRVRRSQVTGLCDGKLVVFYRAWRALDVKPMKSRDVPAQDHVLVLSGQLRNRPEDFFRVLYRPITCECRGIQDISLRCCIQQIAEKVVDRSCKARLREVGLAQVERVSNTVDHEDVVYHVSTFLCLSGPFRTAFAQPSLHRTDALGFWRVAL